MAKTNEMLEQLLEAMKVMNARIEAIEAGTTEKADKADKKADKADKKAETVVVDEVTYRTQEFHKELKAVGMVSGKDYWIHTNEKKQVKLFACVHHSNPEWAKRLEALGFIPTRAYGGSTPAFAMYCRTTRESASRYCSA